MSHDAPRVDNESADREGELVAAMIKQARTRTEDGSLRCSCCGQAIDERSEGNYFVSLMGRGVFCKNGKCA